MYKYFTFFSATIKKMHLRQLFRKIGKKKAISDFIRFNALWWAEEALFSDRHFWTFLFFAFLSNIFSAFFYATRWPTNSELIMIFFQSRYLYFLEVRQYFWNVHFVFDYLLVCRQILLNTWWKGKEKSRTNRSEQLEVNLCDTKSIDNDLSV